MVENHLCTNTYQCMLNYDHLWKKTRTWCVQSMNTVLGGTPCRASMTVAFLYIDKTMRIPVYQAYSFAEFDSICIKDSNANKEPPIYNNLTTKQVKTTHETRGEAKQYQHIRVKKRKKVVVTDEFAIRTMLTIAGGLFLPPQTPELNQIEHSEII